MKNTMKKIVSYVTVIFMGGLVMAAPVLVGAPAMAECNPGEVPSAILGTQTSTGSNGERCVSANADAIKNILKLIVEIMTIAIGIVAVIGITISGIQYITAGGNEEQTRKAKRRIFEIVIGLFAYVLIYAALNFLIPDFKPFN